MSQNQDSFKQDPRIKGSCNQSVYDQDLSNQDPSEQDSHKQDTYQDSQVVSDTHATSCEYVTDSIYGRFLRRVEEDPHARAVVDASGAITRAELAQRAGEVASQLPPGVRRVGVAMSHGIPQIAAILGILKADAAYVPVELDFPQERIRYMMDNAQVDCVITDEGIQPRPSKEDRSTGEDHRAIEAAKAQGLAYILYTSGTTGKPKGVMVTNANVCNYIDAFAAEFHPTARDTMLQYSVCSFDIFVEEVFSALLTGMILAIPTPTQRADIGALMEFVGQNNVTIISGFPYLLQEMNELPSVPACLRLLISGGDVLRARYVDKLIDSLEVYNTYGPSETTVCASYFRCKGARALPDGTYPVGFAVHGVSVRIVDDSLREVDAGVVGEIVIAGKGVGLGYVGDPPEQSNFIELPPAGNSGASTLRIECAYGVGGARAYRSGDMGYKRADGSIAFLHRKDTQVMIEGRRVEPSEVESVLCACAEVETGVVCSAIDADEMSYLVGYYVPVGSNLCASTGVDGCSQERGARIEPDNSAISDKEMEKLLREKMSRYLASYMLPEYFVKMDHLPLTPNGKVDTRALPQVQRV